MMINDADDDDDDDDITHSSVNVHRQRLA